MFHEDKQVVYGNVPEIVIENLPSDEGDKIYSVTMSWYMEDEKKWTYPSVIDYLKMGDDDLELACVTIAKDYGAIKENSLMIKSGRAQFYVQSDTFYRFTISPIIVRDI